MSESALGLTTSYGSVDDDEGPSKTSKIAYSFMEKRQRCRVIEETVDLTPDDVVSPNYAYMVDSFSHAAFEVRVRRSQRSGLKHNMAPSGEAMKVFATTINLDDIHIDHTLNTEEGVVYDEVDLEKAPSAYYLPKQLPIMSYPPEVILVYKETPTIMLFELPSFSYDKGSEMGSLVEEENEFYQYITVGKGRNRKMVVEETQTEPVVTQSRHTNAVRPDKKNSSAFASVWDMHDTYAKLALHEHVEEPDEMVLYQSADPALLRKKKKSFSRRGKTFEEVAQMHSFYDAVMLTERVLAAKDYIVQQKRFRGLVAFDPLALDLVYVYTMKPLWTLECEETEGRPITSISFNPKNENIMAVGYGKYAYAEHLNGLICIWCTKNPCKPERMYRFDDPLTSVAFSDCNPNWLAAGFANGDVIILDITHYCKKLIAQSTRDTNPCFEPIWSINWRKIDAVSEYVMTSCQDGRINRFTSTKTHDFICTLMMRISTVEGKMKGLQTAKTCLKVDVPITRYPAALCVRWHPFVDHVYLVGTDEGCIHKCSKHYLNQHMDVYRAHAGPVYAIDVSPFLPPLLVSCGADGAIRLWYENMDEVIMTLNCPSAVNCVAFCPINSTIIISVSGNLLSIWDLRRKNHIPCAEYSFPGSVILTFIKFSKSGENVFVGDSVGRVHTFHLEDTPLPPFYQRKMLNDAIKKALCTRPHMLKQLAKLNAIHKQS